MNIDGIVLIDKPKGWSSFDIVAKIRGHLKQETGLKKPKVGHTGTLDPLATGLMIVVTGKYTKRASEFSKLDKVYETTMILGKTSTTGDDEGEKVFVSEYRPDESAILPALEGMQGEISQVPPIYSAVKVNGQRAYALARKGKEVKLEPRQIVLHDIHLDSYNYPEVKFTAHVSSGTYIRSLVEDIGKVLGTGAYMSDLRRTRVGKYDLEAAIPVDNFSIDKIKTA